MISFDFPYFFTSFQNSKCTIKRPSLFRVTRIIEIVLTRTSKVKDRLSLRFSTHRNHYNIRSKVSPVVDIFALYDDIDPAMIYQKTTF